MRDDDKTRLARDDAQEQALEQAPARAGSLAAPPPGVRAADDPAAAGGLLDDAARSVRMRQLDTVLWVGFAATAFIAALNADWRSCAVLGLGTAAILSADALRRRGRLGLAGALTMWSLVAAVAYEMWIHQGLYSPALVVVPTLLLMSHMLLGARQAGALFASMLAVLAALAAAALVFGHRFVVGPPSWSLLGYDLVFLVVFAFVTRLMVGDLRRAMARVRDEMARVRESQERLAHQASHDELTGRPNLRHCRELAARALAQARDEGHAVGVLLLDLDHFKSVNESFGHPLGDALLREVALRLCAHVRPGDVVARHSGDEFVVLLPRVAEAAEVASVAAALQAVLAVPVQVADLGVSLTASIGAAIFPADGDDFDTLLKHADLAARHAKDGGRHALRFFSQDMIAGVQDDLRLEADLRPALARGEFALRFQPVVALADGAVVGAECLLHWAHPVRGPVSPARFIPLAERTGFIGTLGEWVLDQALRQLEAWRGGDLGDLVLSVNVSAIQFRRGAVDAMVARALSRHDVPPSRLELEVTESALVQDAERFVSLLHALKQLGVRIAIDDFGTGYSNLAYLQRFDVDKLKIDQCFVRGLPGSEPDRAIVRAIVHLAQALRLRVTAEGIEDEAVAAHLREIGCDQGQGYAYAPPLAGEDFEAFCRQRRARAAAAA